MGSAASRRPVCERRFSFLSWEILAR